MEEDELHEIEEHHLPTTPTLTTTTSDDKENDAQVLKHFQFILFFLQKMLLQCFFGLVVVSIC